MSPAPPPLPLASAHPLARWPHWASWPLFFLACPVGSLLGVLHVGSPTGLRLGVCGCRATACCSHDARMCRPFGVVVAVRAAGQVGAARVEQTERDAQATETLQQRYLRLLCRQPGGPQLGSRRPCKLPARFSGRACTRCAVHTHIVARTVHRLVLFVTLPRALPVAWLPRAPPRVVRDAATRPSRCVAAPCTASCCS